MLSRRLAILTAAVGLFASTALAQSPQIVKGSNSALHGLTRVYVDVPGDAKLASVVADEVRKQLPDITLVSTREEGAIILQFALHSLEVPDRSTRTTIIREQASYRERNSAGNVRATGAQARAFGQQSEQGPPPAKNTRSVIYTNESSDVPSSSPAQLRAPQAFGRILTPAGPDSFAKVADFRSTVWRESLLEPVVSDFVRKFAKEYRKVNAPNP